MLENLENFWRPDSRCNRRINFTASNNKSEWAMEPTGLIIVGDKILKNRMLLPTRPIANWKGKGAQ